MGVPLVQMEELRKKKRAEREAREKQEVRLNIERKRREQRGRPERSRR